MKMIHNAKDWHKMWSVRLAILTAILSAVQASLPMWAETVSPGAFAWISTGTAIAVAVARVIKQETLE